jgi:hypothetical protein
MEARTAPRRLGLLMTIVAGIVTGTVLMLFTGARGFGLDHGLAAVAESLVQPWAGAFAWILKTRRGRLRRRTFSVIGINCTAWTVFLAFTPAVESAPFELIARQRAAADDGRSAFVGNPDAPTILAARYFGGYRQLPLPEIALTLLAGPAAAISEQCVVSGRYAGSSPTRGESYVIAPMTFGISTAFWATMSEVIAADLRRKARLTA